MKTYTWYFYLSEHTRTLYSRCRMTHQRTLSRYSIVAPDARSAYRDFNNHQSRERDLIAGDIIAAGNLLGEEYLVTPDLTLLRLPGPYSEVSA